MKKFIGVLLIIGLSFAVIAPAVPVRAELTSVELKKTAAQEDEIQQIALQAISDREGVSIDRLEVVSVSRKDYAVTGISFYLMHVLDTQNDRFYRIALDRDGKVVDAEQAFQAEVTAQDTAEGRIHQDLKEQLNNLDNTDTITVAIWLETPDFEAPSRPVSSYDPRDNNVIDDAQMDQARDAARDMLISQMDQVQDAILTDLESSGHTPIYVSPLAPLLYVELPKSDVYDLAERSDVDMMYGPNDNEDMMNVAKMAHHADVVDDLWGYDGSGVDLGILEDSRIEFNNPYLNAGTTRVPGDPNVDFHATGTGGMVASQHPTYQGIAQGVNLFSANATDYTDPNLSAAMDWAALSSEQNLDIINNSWGSGGGTTLNEHARHLDYIVRNLWSTVTVSAGNDGNSTEYVGNPGRAYNVITVGAFDDQGTARLDDDTMAGYSSFRDPSTGAEKPEVVASGSSITSTTEADPWIGNVGGGTSYSAPMVAGEAALLMQVDSELKIFPEAVKAIIMATAVHNIEGSSRLSEYDGVGGVDMRRAVRLVQDQTFKWKDYDESELPADHDYFIRKGEEVRAVIVYDSNPNASYTTDPLEANLDLYVYKPSGPFETFSVSLDDPFEIVEFTAEESGLYTFRINDIEFEGTQEYVGLAVWAGDRKTVADMDKDYDTDIAVYRPGNGNWYVKGQDYTSWGNTGDIPVPADYDGDGGDDIAVFRPGNGKWYVKDQGNYSWGFSNDVPMPCDYDGDGDDDIAVYRPSNGNWYVKGLGRTSWGFSGDIPVPADYDGNGSCDIAVYRPSNGKWYIYGESPVKWGFSGDIPVPGDYDGDGRAEIAVYRPSNGNWYVEGIGATSWGQSGDIAVPGDYDGDGQMDYAVLRPGNGRWYVYGMSPQKWFSSGDIPLPPRDTNADGDPHH
jgi:hypothetical protein